MTQSRRVSPRIPYDEAICLARLDGEGRLYGRGLDLSASGISLVSAEALPIGTEIKCHLLLPHGPRSVSGKIVRVTAAPGGFELAVSFGELKPAVATAIDHLLVDVAPDDEPRSRTRRYGAVTAAPENVGAAGRDGLDPGQTSSAPAVRLPPKNLPPPCGHPLPSVVVAGVSRDERAVESQPPRESRPPRRRVHGTAEIMRKPELSAWWRPAGATGVVPSPMPALIATERLATLEHPSTWGRAWWAIVPIALALVAVIAHFGL